MGLKLWPVCFSESLQTRHTGCWWSRQKSLSFSECRLQRAGEELWSLSMWVSRWSWKQTVQSLTAPTNFGLASPLSRGVLLNSRSVCGASSIGLNLCSVCFSDHLRSRNSLYWLLMAPWQKSLSFFEVQTWQTRQVKILWSDLEAIESPGEAENRQSVSHSSTSFTEVYFPSESRCLLNSRSVCGASAGCSWTLLSCSWTHSGRLVWFGSVWFGRWMWSSGFQPASLQGGTDASWFLWCVRRGKSLRCWMIKPVETWNKCTSSSAASNNYAPLLMDCTLTL